MSISNQNKAYFFAATAIFFWSTVATAFKLSLEYLEPVQLVFYATIFSVLALFFILLFQGKLKLIRRFTMESLLRCALLAILNPCLYYIILLKAYDILPAQEAMAINYSWVVMMVILSIPILKQRIGMKAFLSIIISYIGVIVIATNGDLLSMQFDNPKGVFYALITTVIWALFWLFNTKQKNDTVVSLFLIFLFSLPIIAFSLAGVSSSFVIPILSQIRVGGKLFSRLALESALTDVFCIVATLSVIEVYTTGIFGVQKTLTYLIELFAIAGFIGVLGGIIWIVIRVFEEQNYIITIAYLILIYLATEYFGGNGPIAALFLGLILNNSKQLSSIKEGILSRSVAEKQKAIQGDLGVEVTSATEKRYYNLISFFLKALFFIYVGILLDITDQTALVIGSILSVLIMITRMGSMPLTKGMPKDQRQLVNAVFARGLAAAVLIQAVIQAGMPGAEYMARVVYVVIIGTIILSSLRVFILRMNLGKTKG